MATQSHAHNLIADLTKHHEHFNLFNSSMISLCMFTLMDIDKFEMNIKLS